MGSEACSCHVPVHELTEAVRRAVTDSRRVPKRTARADCTGLRSIGGQQACPLLSSYCPTPLAAKPATGVPDRVSPLWVFNIFFFIALPPTPSTPPFPLPPLVLNYFCGLSLGGGGKGGRSGGLKGCQSFLFQIC